MQRVSHLLRGVLSKRGIDDHAEAAMIAHRLASYLRAEHPTLAPFLMIKRVQDGAVTMLSTHSVALQEAQQLMPKLLEVANTGLQTSVIRCIHVVRA